jgi:hypothetical protein
LADSVKALLRLVHRYLLTRYSALLGLKPVLVVKLVLNPADASDGHVGQRALGDLLDATAEWLFLGEADLREGDGLSEYLA